MALVISDRIKESSTTTGTGTLTLGGAVTGFETFTANLSNGDTTYYCCTDNTDFEVGLGTFTSSGTTLLEQQYLLVLILIMLLIGVLAQELCFVLYLLLKLSF